MGNPESPIANLRLGDQGFPERPQGRFVFFAFEKALSQKSVDRSIVCSESNGLEKVFAGFFEVLFAEVGESEILMGAEEGRKDREGLFIIGFGVVEFGFFAENVG